MIAMACRFLNLNIYKGKYLPKIIEFVKQERFDLVHFQEVSGGSISQDQAHDDFRTLSQELALQGKLASAMGIKGDSQAYFGNATFFNPTKFKLIKTQVLRLSPYQELENYETRRIEDDPRCALIMTFKTGAKQITTINTHLAWGPRPDDKPYKVKQACILLDFVKKLKSPFILSGDFNLAPDTQIVQSFDEIGRNLSLEQGLTNTLNPQIHRVKNLFPAGLLVDYVYVSQGVKIERFEVKPIDLSDHYPSVAAFSLT
jgi:endonuclease/exonuclease/phosphatase family metal-dependent hydrolase